MSTFRARVRVLRHRAALLFPLNALNLNSSGIGVAVLDMADPVHPKQTAMLTEVPMLTPHESLSVNQARGLLAAVSGNPATAPGLVSLYDVSADCRKPVLQFTKPLARFGHESGFSIDGKTFYATGTATESITAIDVADTKNPHVLWQGSIVSHGMSLSDDGNRAYIADPNGGDMLILDTSEIQARKNDPQAREVSRITWKPVLDPAERDPVHPRRASLRARVRRVQRGHARHRQPRRGGRRAHHRHRRRDASRA